MGTANNSKHRILVTGGAGYIGSHATRKFLDAGYEVVVYDNLSTGFRSAVPAEAIFIEGDIRDQEKLSQTLRDFQIECVVHFAGKLIVEESVKKPYLYFDNNVGGSIALVSACQENNIKKLVFSSTAAVYGNVGENELVTEESPVAPLNPYGQTKLAVEGILKDGHAAYGLEYVALRYFNVAGAAEDGTNGQRTKNATHLIKVALEAALGLRPYVEVFGGDYNTEDGTCVRDFIHVEDLADIHVLSVNYLFEGGEATTLNCGYGEGFSVLEVIETLKKISGKDFKVKMANRRAGDAAQVVANSSKAREVLGWTPKRADLEFICRTAYDWEVKQMKSADFAEDSRRKWSDRFVDLSTFEFSNQLLH